LDLTEIADWRSRSVGFAQLLRNARLVVSPRTPEAAPLQTTTVDGSLGNFADKFAYWMWNSNAGLGELKI
jgi:hypothetical protein